MAGRSHKLTGSATVRPTGISLLPTINNGTCTTCRYKLPSVEEQPVIAQVLAVIRSDDHQRILEHSPAGSAHQAMIPAGDRDKKCNRHTHQLPCVRLRVESVVLSIPVKPSSICRSARCRGPETKARYRPVRNLVRAMRVVEIEKREERPPVLRPLSQPSQKRIVDRIRTLQVLSDRGIRSYQCPVCFSTHASIVRRPRRDVDPPPERDVAGEGIEDAEWKILVMGKTASQPCLPAAIIEIRHEPRCSHTRAKPGNSASVGTPSRTGVFQPTRNS